MRYTGLRALASDSPADWPGPLRALLAILLLLVVLLAGHGFYLEAGLERVEQLRYTEARLREQVAGKVRDGAGLEAYRQQLLFMQGEFQRWLQLFPGSAETPGLLEDISRLGVDVGLDFEEIRPQPEQPWKFLVQLPIQLTVTGAYHDLAIFVGGLAALPRFLTLHDIRIGPVDAADPVRLRMQLEARTYRYEDPETNS
ncbi:type 4a pilus biogenesis protein PilO [Pseudomonas sp. MSSRFD41]|uniref:type 4a pilus biogenesis protein PilO n=1 Tax=Pseudomonas sp. MSSRFD41 TaxID=1310370 RepID=UPI001639C170|nr:type 4a pilus biogenesis protein PilO [Pseudomonas sp. MSSRFD41]MBC2654717.1 type 4a pilus biogenesis protein PilO [Pseudomonas sp. MSSRFD41]